MPPRPLSSTERHCAGPLALTRLGPVAALMQRAEERAAVDRALRQTLPQPLRDQVQFADQRETRLIFLASSPVWATRLRLRQDTLFRTAHAIGIAADRLSIKIVALPQVSVAAPAAKPLSAVAAKHLQAAAQSIADPELQQLFLQLAQQAAADTP